jgi:hypothetical protein
MGSRRSGKVELLDRRLAGFSVKMSHERTVLAGEAFGADGASAIEVFLLERFRLRFELGRQEVGELGVVARIAGKRRRDRVELEVLLQNSSYIVLSWAARDSAAWIVPEKAQRRTEASRARPLHY